MNVLEKKHIEEYPFMIELSSGYGIDAGVIIVGLLLILLGFYAATQAKSIGDIILEKLQKSEEKIIEEIWKVKL